MTLISHTRALVRRLTCAAAAGLFVLGSTGAAGADDAPFPSRPLKLIVPYAPGGGTDVIARLYAEHLSRRLGQGVVVENRPGAATNLGAQALASAEPNGYTLMLGSNQLVINAVFGPKPPFDPVNGIAPVAVITEVPYVLAVKADSPVKRARDLLPSGTPRELAVSHAQFDVQLKLLSQAMAVPVLGIPYQGGAQAITAALAGDVPTVFAGVSAVAALVKSGQLRLVGVTSARRVAAFPEVPTFTEQGYPEFVTTGWMSVLAPRGTPAAALQRLSEATAAITRDPGFMERVRASGAEPVEAGPAEATARLVAEHALWSKVAR